MRVLPIGLALARSSGWLLVGIGLMVIIFASRQLDPWPSAKMGAAIAGTGVGLIVAVLVRSLAQRQRQCLSCERELPTDVVECPHCATRPVW